MYSGTERIPPLKIKSVCCSAAQILNHLHECLGVVIYKIVGNIWKSVDSYQWRSSCFRDRTCVIVLFKNHVSVKMPKTDYSYNINVIIFYKIDQLTFLTMYMINFMLKCFFNHFIEKKRWYDFRTTMNMLPNIERRCGLFFVPRWTF